MEERQSIVMSDFSDISIIGTDIKCSQDLRAWFKSRLGKGFHFLVPFQQWLHDNPDKTLGEACAAYKNPEMTFEKTVSNWNTLKA